MEDLSIEEIGQLINFYRQRASELEFQVLQLQLKIAKLEKSNIKTNGIEKTSKNKTE